MIFLHPRRYIRRLFNSIGRMVFLIRCRLRHVNCAIGKDTIIHHCLVRAKQNGSIIIGERCDIRNTVFHFYGEGGRILIRNHVRINARPEAKTQLYVKNHTSILIDDDCLLSNFIDISTTDWHKVINENGEMINPNKDVKVGKHVWIGRKVMIGKGVVIKPDTIIGACSIVTRPIEESNVMAAGNPAQIKKTHVNWE